MLPDLDGLSVCHILGAQPSTHGTPVFIISALGETWASKQGRRAPFSRYFKKPVELKVLVESIHEAARETQSRSMQCSA
jgi:DNA-binding response OmpR family regulator